MNLSGGEALVKSLVKEGVEVVFGIPGIQLYGVVAALRDEPSIRMVTTRHEQATTYMADGYARAARQTRCRSRCSRRRRLQRRIRSRQCLRSLFSRIVDCRTNSTRADR